MEKVSSFFYIRAAEAALILCILIVLFVLDPDSYWPGRPSGAVSLVAGASWVLILFYVFWGYLLTSAAGYFASGVSSSWKPPLVAATSAVVFAIHSVGIISYSGIRLTMVLWLAWLVVVFLNGIMPILVLQYGSRGVMGNG
jgi:hypothetical protein